MNVVLKKLNSYMISRKKYRCSECRDTGLIDAYDMSWGTAFRQEPCPYCSGRVPEQYELNINGEEK